MDSEKGSQSLTVSALDHYKFTLIFTHIFSKSPLVSIFCYHHTPRLDPSSISNPTLTHELQP